MFYARVYVKFGVLVRIVVRVSGMIMHFLIFFIFWNLIFAMFSFNIDENWALEGGSFAGLSDKYPFWYNLINSFSISMGAIVSPTYDNWSNVEKEGTDDAKTIGFIPQGGKIVILIYIVFMI